MSLRKPSEFFKNNQLQSSLDVAKEQLDSTAPEQIEKISEVFDHFKTNFSHLQKLSDFTNSFESFSSNIKKVTVLSEEVEKLQTGLQDFIRKEDLDDVMLAQILLVEESIRDIQQKVKSINSETLSEIQKQVFDVSDKVNNFVAVESISYKKSVVDSETRIDNRFLQYKQKINDTVSQIEDDISNRFLSFEETLQSINEESLEVIVENLNSVDKKVENILNKDLPKYQKFFVETELKTEKKLVDAETFFNERASQVENNYQSDIASIKEQLNDFIDEEMPRFKNTLVEIKIHSEEEINKISENINEKLLKAYNDIESLQKQIESKDETVSGILAEKISEIRTFIEDSKSQIDSTSVLYKNLYTDFKQREIYESRKLEDYSDLLNKFSSKLENIENTFTEDICEIQSNLDISTSKYYDILKKEVGFFEQNISTKLKDLEINFERNEIHILNAKKELQEVISKLNIDEIESKNKKLFDRINQLESVLEKFDEKKLLFENVSPTLTNPPNTKTSDPLTPLDQNFITLDQLQSHYRLFIHRIQQQLSTIGGGGAVRLDDLDDVDRTSAKVDGYVLAYHASTGKFIGTAVSGGTLIGLTDVDSSNLGDGRFLRYDASTSDFTFAPVSATNLELIAGDIQSGILTTNSTNQAVVMSISASTYRSVQYQVQVTEGTNYNMTSINVLHDGTTTYMSEYGTINQPIGVATFSSDISGGALRLLGFPTFASDTTFKTIFTAIES